MIRPMTPGDVPWVMGQLQDFHKTINADQWASWEDSKQSWEEFIRLALEHPAYFTVVEDELQGLLCAVIGPIFWNPALSVVSEQVIWVPEKSRRRGVAKQMIQAMEAWAKLKGASMNTFAHTNYAHDTTGEAGIPKIAESLGYTPGETFFFKIFPRD